MTAEDIVRIANQNEGMMDGTTETVSRILRDADVVFAVWQDWRSKNGVSTLILKGEALLTKIAKGSSSLGVEIKWSAVKVLNMEMAVAARHTLGDAGKKA